jgi:hypothetical protein
MSLSVAGMTALLRDLGARDRRALPSTNLVIVNGHGGNRGILERWLVNCARLRSQSLRAAHRRADRAGDRTARAGNSRRQGRDIGDARARPYLVRRKAIADLKRRPKGDAIRALILDPAASFAWRATIAGSPKPGHR